MQVVSIRVTFILTPMSTVLLEKLIGSQLIQKLPAFYAAQMFITSFIRARHLSVLTVFMNHSEVYYHHLFTCIMYTQL
jgi:hypothetical protein